MGFREVSVVEVREVLRAWLEGHGLRRVAERAGVDRKTARRYVAAAEAAGLARDAGVEAVADELVGVVVDAVRPSRPNGHGESWETLLGYEVMDSVANRNVTQGLLFTYAIPLVHTGLQASGKIGQGLLAVVNRDDDGYAGRFVGGGGRVHAVPASL